MEQGLLHSERGTAPANKTAVYMLLHMKAPEVMVHKKEGRVVVEVLYGSCVKLSFIKKEGKEVLRNASNPLRVMLVVPFQGMLGTIEQFIEDIF